MKPAATLLTPREAAAAIGVSYPTIKQWILAGKLSTIKTPGRPPPHPAGRAQTLPARATQTARRHLARAFSPGQRAQSTDRHHRRGQN
jgi:excisionase family DNA binding protein